jgi:hypothetical protein
MCCFSSPAKRGARRAAWTRLLAAPVLIATFAGVATAQSVWSGPVRDDARGLNVLPPAGYGAFPMAPIKPFTALIFVQKLADRDTGCQVGFMPVPQYAAYTQDEVNGLIASQEWLDPARATLFTGNYDILDTARLPRATSAAWCLSAT